MAPMPQLGDSANLLLGLAFVIVIVTATAAGHSYVHHGRRHARGKALHVLIQCGKR